MSRILITGAGGFTGQYLSRALSEVGAEVHGTVLADGDVPGSYAALHKTDLTSLRDVRGTVRAVRPNIVFHLAGISFAAHEDIKQLYLNNVVGTRFLLEALGDASGVEHVIIASSANVYGSQQLAVLSEDVLPTPVNDYGISKLATEQIAGLFRDRLPISIVRPFNYTGVGQPTSFLIPKIVDHFRSRRTHIDLGNIDVERDFSDVRDVCQIYRRLMNSSDAIGSTLNICSGKAISPAEIIRICSELTGHSLEIRRNPDLVRSAELKTLRGSRVRLEATIGEVSIRPFSETLRWMLEAN
jgi:Nucleoside-diphosphate-sugar epimerases